MVTKENRRVMLTKRMLKDALVELLRKKDIYHISVRELCECADINRTTFYKYYGSQFDLLTDMESDIIAFINSTISKNQFNIDNIIRTLCDYLESNIDFARLLINNNIDPQFAEKMFSLPAIKDSVGQLAEEYLDESEKEYIYNFVTYGSFRIICMWINKEDRESSEKIAVLIKKLTVNR